MSNGKRIEFQRRKTQRERERILREQEKRLKRERAEILVKFFTEGPSPHLLRDPKFKDPKLQEHFRKRLREVAEVIKQVIINYEDFFKAKVVEAGFEDSAEVEKARRKLQEALDKLNQLPTQSGRFAVVLDPVWEPIGEVVYERKAEGLDRDAVEFYGDEWLAYLMAEQIENFKRALVAWQERFPVGVCRLEDCRKLFVKPRRDALYCSPRHANTAAVRRKRASERRKRRTVKKRGKS
jgi:hypothetical protein